MPNDRAVVPAEGKPPGPALFEAADTNLVTHFTWAQSRTPGMRALVDPELVLTDSGLDCDTFNAISRARLPSAHAGERIRAAIAHFTSRGFPFAWWHGPADTPTDLAQRLLDAGLRHADSELAMACDLNGLLAPDPLPAGLEIRRVTQAAELVRFGEVIARVSEPEEPLVPAFYAQTAAHLLATDSPLHFYLGMLDGQVVATAECTLAGGVAGIYNITTLPPYRRRGIASALTHRALRDARAAGYTIAVLQAAREGVNLYRRLGFRAYGDIHEYKPPGAR